MGGTTTARGGRRLLLPWMGPAAALVLTLAGALAVANLRRGHVFPFVELQTVHQLEEFNAPPPDSARDQPPDIRAITREVRRIMVHGDAPMLTEPPLGAGDDSVVGVCSEFAKTAQALGAQDGHEFRTVWLSTHTVNEYWDPDRERWILLDTNGNQKWICPQEGEPLSVAELVAGHPAEPRAILASPGDNPHFGPEALRHYRDTDVVVVVEDERLFDFHLRNRSPLAVGAHLLFGSPVARGIQFVPEGNDIRAGSIIPQLRLVLALILLAWVVAATWWFHFTGRLRGGVRAATTGPAPSAARP